METTNYRLHLAPFEDKESIAIDFSSTMLSDIPLSGQHKRPHYYDYKHPLVCLVFNVEEFSERVQLAH